MEIVIELPQDIHKLCRTCMDMVKTNKKDIFNDDNEILLVMLQNITSMKISPEDGLPKYLCAQCVKRLEFSYHFKQQCEETFLSFKGFLNPSETESKIKEENTQFLCVDCLETFSSQYQLNKHEIEHFKGQSLTKRYLNNNDKDSEEIEIDINSEDVLNLIEERKNDIVEVEIEVDEEEINLDKKIEQFEVKNTENIDLNESIDGKICDICDREYPNTLSLSLHFINHALLTESDTDPDIFKQYFFCDNCGETFDTKTNLNSHTSACFNNSSYKCDKCEIECDSDIELLKHDDREHKLINNLSWNDVFLKTIEKSEFLCPICTEQFTTKDDLTVHSVKHVLKQVNCRICKKTFCSQIARNNHLRSHPNYKHVCDRCGRCLGSRHALKTHIMGVHSTTSNYVCNVCSKKFKTPSRLYIHKLIHKKDKKFDCRLCDYKTNNVGDLKVHGRIHTLERPYKCNFVNCNRRFKTSSHLNEHIQRHLQIKKYQCDQCHMVFGHHHSLKMHIMVHTGEKPFTCEVCGLKFRRKHHLKNHMKQHEQPQDDISVNIEFNNIDMM